MRFVVFWNRPQIYSVANDSKVQANQPVATTLHSKALHEYNWSTCRREPCVHLNVPVLSNNIYSATRPQTHNLLNRRTFAPFYFCIAYPRIQRFPRSSKLHPSTPDGSPYDNTWSACSRRPFLPASPPLPRLFFYEITGNRWSYSGENTVCASAPNRKLRRPWRPNHGRGSGSRFNRILPRRISTRTP